MLPYLQLKDVLVEGINKKAVLITDENLFLNSKIVGIQ